MPEWLDLPVAGVAARVLQLTDLHLCADPQRTLLGLHTTRSFQAVLARATQEFPAADLCLLTGDLAEDGSDAAYQCLADLMQAAPWPASWIPGNHDDSARLAAAAGPAIRHARAIRLGRWRLVQLDSSVPGRIGGELGEVELAFLEQALREAGDDPVLVVLHHHPLPCGCTWLDTQQVADAQAFWDLLVRFPAVRAVLCGHIHQVIDVMHRGIRLLSSPSTCVQFMPGSAHFRLETRGPGYRWLVLHPDGRLDTAVVRLPAGEFPVDDRNHDGY